MLLSMDNTFRWADLSDMRTYNNIREIATGQEDDYTTGCLLDYPHFKEHYKMIAIDLSKQQERDADPKAYNKLISLRIYLEVKMKI